MTLEQRIHDLYADAVSAQKEERVDDVQRIRAELRSIDHPLAATHADFFAEVQDTTLDDLNGKRDRLQRIVDTYRSLEARKELIDALNLIAYYDQYAHDTAQQLAHALEALRLTEDGETRSRLEALRLAGMAQSDSGNVQEGLRYIYEAIDLARETDSTTDLVALLRYIGMMHYTAGNSVDAEKFCLESIELGEQTNANSELSYSYSTMSWLCVDTANYPLAVEYATKALDLTRKVPNTTIRMAALNMLGVAYMEVDDLEQSLRRFNQLLDTATELQNNHWAATANMNIGEVLDLMGRHEESLPYTMGSYNVSLAANLREGIEHALMRQMETYVNLGDYEAARRALDKLDIEAMTLPRPRLGAMVAAGRILLHEGSVADAKAILRRVIDEGTTMKIFSRVVKAHKGLREIALSENDLQAYAEHTDAFIALNDEIRGQKTSKAMAIKEKEQEIALAREAVERQQQLLYAALPQHIADRMLAGEDVSGDQIDHAVVLFVDIVGFTQASSRLDARTTTALLEEIFSHFDGISEKNGLTKIKTIGDSYMAVAFPQFQDMSVDGSDSAQQAPSIEQRAALAALEMIGSDFYWPTATANSDGNSVQFRIGLHSGPITAGVIGSQRLQYDVWGDTVNTASRMESTGEAGRIQVSSEFHRQLNSGVPWNCCTVERGPIDIKGKGTLTTYWLEGA